MNFKPTRIDAEGNLPVQRSISAGDTPAALNPGELAVNAADGVLYVGLNTGKASTLPRAIGFSSIEALTQGQYDSLISATATSSTVLYIVTPDPA